MLGKVIFHYSMSTQCKSNCNFHFKQSPGIYNSLRFNLTITLFLQTKNGEIYDCVNIYEQPSLKHPSLKNHKFEVHIFFTYFLFNFSLKFKFYYGVWHERLFFMIINGVSKHSQDTTCCKTSFSLSSFFLSFFDKIQFLLFHHSLQIFPS